MESVSDPPGKSSIVFSRKRIKIGLRVRVDVVAEMRKLARLVDKSFEELNEETMNEYLRKHGIIVDQDQIEADTML